MFPKKGDSGGTAEGQRGADSAVVTGQSQETRRGERGSVGPETRGAG